jgi:hypothetical protein
MTRDVWQRYVSGGTLVDIVILMLTMKLVIMRISWKPWMIYNLVKTWLLKKNKKAQMKKADKCSLVDQNPNMILRCGQRSWKRTQCNYKTMRSHVLICK